MLKPLPAILSIEEARRVHRRLSIVYFAWYLLGNSAIVFWGEVTMLLTGLIYFLVTDIRVVELVPTVTIGMNVILSVFLTFSAVQDHSRRRVEQMRRIALRAHPILGFFWWSYQFCCFLRSSAQSTFAQPLVLVPDFDEDDDESA